MDIQEYADVINANLKITRYHNQRGRWSAKFEFCEVKDGVMLVGEYGNGKNPTQAIDDYLKRILGKTIVFNAMADSRREFNVPATLTGITCKVS